MKTIHITLTEEQRVALNPLYEQVILADHANKKGAILIQPQKIGVLSAIFVPHEQTNKIIEILKEIK